jgi:hypothetical protein
MTSLDAFEQAVIRMFCQIGDVRISNLTDHIPHLKVTKRELTGVGIFVELNSSLPVIGNVQATISGVAAQSGRDAPILGFVLFIDENKPVLLEGFAYSGAWPEDLSDYTLYFG